MVKNHTEPLPKTRELQIDRFSITVACTSGNRRAGLLGKATVDQTGRAVRKSIAHALMSGREPDRVPREGFRVIRFAVSTNHRLFQQLTHPATLHSQLLTNCEKSDQQVTRPSSRRTARHRCQLR